MDASPSPKPEIKAPIDSLGSESVVDPTADSDPDTTEPTYKPGVDKVKFHPNPKAWLVILFVVLAAAAGGYYYYLNYYHKSKPAATVTKHDVPLIRLGLTDGPVDEFYPHVDLSDGTEYVNSQIFESLVGWQDGTKVVPLLATGWTNPDDSTWIFTLRSGVKFHTGHLFSADDVKSTLDSYKDVVAGGEFGSTIKSVEVLAPNKVKIITDGPDPLLLNRLTRLQIIDSHSTAKDDPINGTGPYVLKPGTDPVKDKVTDLVAFDGYWGGHVYTRELQIRELTKETEGVNDLKSHTLDVYDFFVSLSNVKAVQSVGMKTTADATYTVDLITLNTVKKGSPLSNLKFRQALNVGIDRTKIIKAAGVDGVPIGQYVTNEVPGYLPSLSAPKLDVAQAKQLISDSGVKNPTLTLSYGDDGSNGGLVKEIQQELAALGVTVKLDSNTDLNTMVSKYLSGGTDMLFVGDSSDILDITNVVADLFQNPPTYDNLDVDNLLTQANQTLNASKRLVLVQQAAQKLHDDAAGIPIYTRNEYYAQANTGYNLHRDIPTLDLGAYFWKVYQQ